MTRLYAITGIAAVAISIIFYVSWLEDRSPRNPDPLCSEVGPVEPIPRIQDHVAAVMDHECRDCETQLKQCLSHETQTECPECPTWNTLKRAGVEIACVNAFGEVPSVNYYEVENKMACPRIGRIVITDKRIEVIRRWAIR